MKTIKHKRLTVEQANEALKPPLILTPIKTEKSPIGYQVVDTKGNYPTGYEPFEILTLRLALLICKSNKRKWRLIPVWEGDIETPHFV